MRNPSAFQSVAAATAGARLHAKAAVEQALEQTGPLVLAARIAAHAAGIASGGTAGAAASIAARRSAGLAALRGTASRGTGLAALRGAARRSVVARIAAHPARPADTHFIRHAHFHTLFHRARYHFRHLIWHLYRNRVRHRLVHGIRNLHVHRSLLHRHHGGGDLPHHVFLHQPNGGNRNNSVDGSRHHAGDRVRFALDHVFLNIAGHRVRHAANFGLLFHTNRGVNHVLANHGAFDKDAAGGRRIVALLAGGRLRLLNRASFVGRKPNLLDVGVACINPGAASHARSRVRDLLANDFRLHSHRGDRHLLLHRLLHHTGALNRNLLLHGDRNALGNGHRHLFRVALANVDCARNLLTYCLVFAHLPGAALIGLAPDQTVFRLAAAVAAFALTAMTVEKPAAAAANMKLAANRVGFAAHVRNLLGHGANGLARLAGPAGTGLHARFLYAMVFGAANGLHDGFAHWATNRVAAFAVARFAHRLANGLAALMAMLLGNAVLNHVAALVAVLFIDRLAGRVDAFLVAGLAHRLAHFVVAFAVACLTHRLAHRLAAVLVDGFVHRLIDAIVTFLHHRLADGPAHGALLGLVGRFAALLVARALFGPVTGLADRPHDRFANRLMADVEPLFGHGIVHQPVRSPRLRLAGSEATLCIAAGLVPTGVLGATAVRSLGRGSGAK